MDDYGMLQIIPFSRYNEYQNNFPYRYIEHRACSRDLPLQGILQSQLHNPKLSKQARTNSYARQGGKVRTIK